MADSMRARFTRVVGDLLDTDDRTVVVLAVISHGLLAAEGIEARHPDRVIDVGIREQAQLGVAGGLALEGFTPIVTGYAPFLVERAFEQIKLDFDHQGTSGILASVGGSWDASGQGRTHQAPEDVALMQSLRSWTIHVPGHPDELELLLRHAHRAGQRTYIRMTTDANPTSYTRIPGRLVTLRRGSIDAPTMLAVGPAAGPTLDAVADIDATVLYTSTPHPLDTTGLRAAVLGSEIVVVEPYLSGTSTAQVAEALTDRPMIIRAHGITNVDLRRYGTPDEHRSVHGLDASGIRAFLDRAPEPVG